MKQDSHKNLLTPPGGALIWFIISLETLTFLAGIFFYFFMKQRYLTMFLEMQQKLNVNFAILNTVFLITSGYFVAMALNYLKNKDRIKSRLFLLIGILWGAAFVVLKLYEYSEKIAQGYTSNYNYFFTFYWLLTLFHLAHVVFATLILLFIYFKLKKEEEGEFVMLEVGSSLWHMCDLIWIILFPTLFLIR